MDVDLYAAMRDFVRVAEARSFSGTARELNVGGPGFDTAYMRWLYDLGYEKARSGRSRQREPPRVEPGLAGRATAGRCSD